MISLVWLLSVIEMTTVVSVTFSVAMIVNVEGYQALGVLLTVVNSITCHMVSLFTLSHSFSQSLSV